MSKDATKTLIVLVGLPYSGKSTWAKKTGLPMVNPDSIRLALHGQRYAGEAEPMVWALAAYFVKALFGAGHSRVILDATNTTRVRRAAWEDPEWETLYHVFTADKDECLARAAAVRDEEIVPHIIRMADNWQPLVTGENSISGFELGLQAAGGRR